MDYPNQPPSQDAGGNVQDPDYVEPGILDRDASAPLTPPAPPAEDPAVIDAQQAIDDAAAELARFDREVAQARLEYVKAHADATDAHARLTVKTYDPETHYGLQQEGGTATYHPHAKGAEVRSRAIRHDGQNYEHVAEDANGVWLYRRM